MNRIIISLLLALTSSFAFSQASTSNGTGQAYSGLNYAPVSNYISPESRPNTVIAPNINPTVNCASTASGGVAFGGVQLVGGGSGKDEDCMNKETIKMVFAMGDPSSAFDMTCAKYPEYRESRIRQGKPCIIDTPEYKAAQKVRVASVIPSTGTVDGKYEGSDPIVRKRLGLPPL